MTGMHNQIRQTASSLAGDEPVRYGLVSGYDPSSYSIKVTLQPEGVETGWLPLTSEWVGNGWGLFSPPALGTSIKVDFQEGGTSNGIASGRTFNDVDRPLAVQAGEFWLVHASGAFLKLTNDGKLAINSQVEVDATGPTINIQATGTVNVMAAGQANVTAPSINLGAAGQSLLSLVTSAFQELFNGHTHTSAASGNPTSSPNQTMGATHVTSTVKGG